MSSRVLVNGFVQGISGIAAVMIVYWISYVRGYEVEKIRALTFFALVLFNLGLVYVNRSRAKLILAIIREKNSAALWISFGTLSILALSLTIPAMRDIFHFSEVGLKEILWTTGIAIVAIMIAESLKAFFFRWQKKLL